ncbi:MAG: hypothetical protein JNK75_05345 [Betaproteobacteria bacterium]|nr:hypothetical protein [Betaproteobacteria bacterium]
MSMKLMRTLLTIWMMLWLPVSGAVAVVMPFQAMGLPSASGAVEQAATDALPMPCHATADDSAVPMPGKCTHCELCHLASALLLLAVPLVDPQTIHPPEFAAPALAFASHIPELLQRPPRITLP